MDWSNREDVSAYNKAYQKENLEKYRKHNRAYYLRKRKKIRQAQRIYILSNLEKERQRHRDYHRRNLPKYAEYTRNYRARKHKAPIKDFTTAQWELLRSLYKFCCVYCGTETERLTVDHFVPLSKGGGHTISNIVPACKSCNCSKNNRPAPPFFRPLFVLNVRFRLYLSKYEKIESAYGAITEKEEPT